MKNNYDLEFQKIAEQETSVKKVLLHSCCAPCSTACLEMLTPYYEVTICFYNPNIEPQEEYERRKSEEKRYIETHEFIHPVHMIDCDYNHEAFIELSKGMEHYPERGPRCIKCYKERLTFTAKKAKELGFDYFCTTLTLSPLKDSQVLNKLGYQVSKEENIPYLPSDFKKRNGYKRSIDLSKENNLYRQDYCGCHFSKEQREQQKSESI